MERTPAAGAGAPRQGRRAFRFSAAVVLWASDDAEREWRETVGPAFLYQQRKYAEWDAGEERAEGYLEDDPALTDLDAVRERMLVGTPEAIAERLTALHAACRSTSWCSGRGCRACRTTWPPRTWSGWPSASCRPCATWGRRRDRRRARRGARLRPG